MRNKSFIPIGILNAEFLAFSVSNLDLHWPWRWLAFDGWSNMVVIAVFSALYLAHEHASGKDLSHGAWFILATANLIPFSIAALVPFGYGMSLAAETVVVASVAILCFSVNYKAYTGTMAPFAGISLLFLSPHSTPTVLFHLSAALASLGVTATLARRYLL